MKDADLLARVKWITDAVASQDLGLQGLNSYLIRNGNIHAHDGRMVVGTPFPFEGPDVLVPAEQFEKVLINKPDGDFTWEREVDRLVLKRGRFKGRIKTMPLEAWVMPTDLPLGLTSIPDGFIESLDSLLPFVSENATKPWAMCVGVQGDYLYASNNIAVARCYCKTDTGVDEFLLPRWVIEFILKRQEGLTAWAIEDGGARLVFLWEDGSWMRSSNIVEKFPDAQAILDKFLFSDDIEVDVEITPEWRKIIRRSRTIQSSVYVPMSVPVALAKFLVWRTRRGRPSRKVGQRQSGTFGISTLYFRLRLTGTLVCTPTPHRGGGTSSKES